MNLKRYKSSSLTAQEQYDIINFAIQFADQDGFINDFIFKKALYVFAAAMLNETRHDEIIKMATEQGIPQTWDSLLEDGSLEYLVDTYAETLDLLADEANSWFADYTEYAQSLRGALDNLQLFAGDLVQSLSQKIDSFDGKESVATVIDIANKWGADNIAPEPEEDNTISELEESLFD